MYVTFYKQKRLRLSTKVIAMLLALLLLPWLFMGNIPETLRYSVDEPAMEPVNVPDFAPVPAGYPVVLQYIPLDLSAVEDWIQNQYPGSLVDIPMLQAIDRAAKEANVNLGILLGILAAEQSMLTPSVVGYAHAMRYYDNPFDYGVYPGSPFPFAIGAYASAKGASSLAVRSMEAFSVGSWSADQFAQWMGFFENWYVNGISAFSTIGDWGNNVSSVWNSAMQYVVQKTPSWFENVTNWIHRAVDAVVNWFTQHKVAIVVGAMVLLAVILVVGSGGSVLVLSGTIASAAVAFNANFSAVLATQ